LETLHPELAKQADGWDPSTLTPGSEKRVGWICGQGHKWKTDPKHRVLGRGCPSCASHGFDPNQEGWLYFLKHRDWGMLQIGITNEPDVRIKKHKSLGWEVIDLRGPMDGQLTRDWETSILQMLKRNGAKLSPQDIAGKFDGYTESWVEASFPAASLVKLMEKVKDCEEQIPLD
jgi:hypothetical protein